MLGRNRAPADRTAFAQTELFMFRPAGTALFANRCGEGKMLTFSLALRQHEPARVHQNRRKFAMSGFAAHAAGAAVGNAGYGLRRRFDPQPVTSGVYPQLRTCR